MGIIFSQENIKTIVMASMNAEVFVLLLFTVVFYCTSIKN